MATMKNIYLFEGVSDIAIVRGSEMAGDRYKNITIKYKGLFGKTCTYTDIHHHYIGTEKKVILNNKPAEGWRCRRIFFSLLDKQPYTPGLNSELLLRIRQVESENERLRTICNHYEDMLKTVEQTDLFDERMKKEFIAVSEAKKQLYTYQDFGIGAGLYGRPPMGPEG